MLTLEQVRALESRVERAMSYIANLREENSTLCEGLSKAESRVAELESKIAEFEKDQVRIEEGIVEALRKLDAFEDSVHGISKDKKPEIVNKQNSPTVANEKPIPTPAKVADSSLSLETPAVAPIEENKAIEEQTPKATIANSEENINNPNLGDNQETLDIF